MVSCDYYYPLYFYNTSKQNVSIYLHETSPMYPDTVFTQKNVIVMQSNTYSYDYGIPWNKVYKDFKIDTMSVFFFDTDTLNKYPWEEIRKDYKILRRYDLSLQDLEYLEYKIYYPPTPKMRDIKMYPPYGVNLE